VSSLEELLSDTDKKRLLDLAKNTLRASFTESPQTPLQMFESEESNLTVGVVESYPCFVTLRKGNGRLRGCIGSMVSFQPLYKNVAQMARQAAFEDPRFKPLVVEELKDTFVDITVLGPMRKMGSLGELKIGRHGLHVAQGHRRGVLLASVAVENRFSPEEFLKETCVKAGLKPDDWEHYDISLFEEISFGDH
jgi:AmmeMemoRadiSam system protein A